MWAGMTGYAQQPSSQPTNLSFYNLKPYGFNLAFTPSSANGYLVLRSVSPITFTPQDGVTYEKGQGVAPGVKVFAVSGSSSASIREVIGGTTYYFAVFAYNGAGSAVDYLNTSPLAGTVTVPTGGPGNYYTSIDNALPAILADLKQRLNTGRVFQSYTPGYINNLMNNFYLRDTVGGKLVSVCQYTGEVYISDPPYTWWGTQGNPGQFTREHSLPKSWMLTGGNTSNQDGADYHNLFPVNQEKANAKRSNYPYGIVQNVTFQYMGSKFGTNSQGITVYEPRDANKGDCARAQFYMMTCYNGNGGTWGYQTMPTYAQQENQDLLKIWNLQDPPDGFERTRHEYIYSIQNNRNPFIDYPELADCINFNNMTLYANCAITLGVDDHTAAAGRVSVYPNPVVAGQGMTIVYEGPGGIRGVTVTDMGGRRVYDGGPANDNVSLTLPTEGLVDGIYFIGVLLSDGSVSTHKMIINH